MRGLRLTRVRGVPLASEALGLGGLTLSTLKSRSSAMPSGVRLRLRAPRLPRYG